MKRFLVILLFFSNTAFGMLPRFLPQTIRAAHQFFVARMYSSQPGDGEWHDSGEFGLVNMHLINLKTGERAELLPLAPKDIFELNLGPDWLVVIKTDDVAKASILVCNETQD